MKKVLLAVAVSVAAGSASAATVYDNNGLTYKVNGDFQIQLRKKIGEDTNEYVDYDDLELKNYVSYELGENLKGFGRLDFDFKDHANGKDVDEPIEEAYVGIQYGVASFSIGKQNFASDEFGIEEAYELSSDEDRFDATGTDGDDTLRADIELDQVFIAASYEMEAEGKGGATGEYFDLFASTEFVGLTLAAAYQNFKADSDADSLDTYGFSASYDAGFANFGADYSTTDDVADQYNVAATFAVASTTSVGLGMVNTDPENGDDVTEWYTNVTYKFPAQKNVSVFAEIGDNDIDNTDMGFLAGMRVKF